MAIKGNKGNQFHMRLYHGTDASQVEKIKKSGLGKETGAYLTHDYDLARYYANAAADESPSGEPVVLTVRANPRNLCVDRNSFGDPVYAQDYGVQKRSFDTSKLRDDDKDWKNSLRETGAVFHEGRINPKDIVGVEKTPRQTSWWDD